MFPRKCPFAGNVAAWWASDEIAMRPSRGQGVQRITDLTRALKGHLSEEIGRSRLIVISVIVGYVWMHHDDLIFIGRAKKAGSMGRVVRSWGDTWTLLEL